MTLMLLTLGTVLLGPVMVASDVPVGFGVGPAMVIVLDVPVNIAPVMVVLDAPVGPVGFCVGLATVVLDVPVGFEVAGAFE